MQEQVYRRGWELVCELIFNDYYYISTNYSFIDPKFINYSVDGISFEGNVIPGISKNFGGLFFERKKDEGFNFSINNYFRTKIYLDDANSAEDSPYHKLNISIAYKFIVRAQLIQAYFNVNNLLNSDYNDNIRINAFGNRYYEAAPGRSYYAGLKIRFQ